MWLKVQYRVVWYRIEILISINCLYWNYEKTRPKLQVSRLYTKEPDILWDTKWQNIAHRVTPFCHFVSALKLLSSDRRKFCVMPVTNYWIHNNNAMTDSLEVVENVGEVLKMIPIWMFNFGHCKLDFRPSYYTWELHYNYNARLYLLPSHHQQIKMSSTSVSILLSKSSISCR